MTKLYDGEFDFNPENWIETQKTIKVENGEFEMFGDIFKLVPQVPIFDRDDANAKYDFYQIHVYRGAQLIGKLHKFSDENAWRASFGDLSRDAKHPAILAGKVIAATC